MRVHERVPRPVMVHGDTLRGNLSFHAIIMMVFKSITRYALEAHVYSAARKASQSPLGASSLQFGSAPIHGNSNHSVRLPPIVPHHAATDFFEKNHFHR